MYDLLTGYNYTRASFNGNVRFLVFTWTQHHSYLSWMMSELRVEDQWDHTNLYYNGGYCSLHLPLTLAGLYCACLSHMASRTPRSSLRQCWNTSPWVNQCNIFMRQLLSFLIILQIQQATMWNRLLEVKFLFVFKLLVKRRLWCQCTTTISFFSPPNRMI